MFRILVLQGGFFISESSVDFREFGELLQCFLERVPARRLGSLLLRLVGGARGSGAGDAHLDVGLRRLQSRPFLGRVNRRRGVAGRSANS